MKKSNVFYAVGTLVLAVGGFMVTKANKKFTQFNSAKVNGLSVITINAASHFTNVANSNARTAFFATRASAGSTQLYTVVTTSSQTHKMYYK